MAIRSRLAILGGLSLLTTSVVSSAPAFAQLSTFAQTNNNRATTTGAFTYTSDGLTGTVGAGTNTGTFSIASTTQIVFNYIANNSYTGDPETLAATVSFTATAVGAATKNADGSYSQAVSGITGSYTADTPDPTTGKSDLLNFSFTSGIFNFTAGSGAATFSASASEAAGPPGLNDFSSDFLNFANPNSTGGYYQSEQLSFGITGLTTAGGATGPTVNANNTIQSFMGDQTASFSSNPIPVSGSSFPEPTALALTVLGAGVTYIPVLRRKRAAKA